VAAALERGGVDVRWARAMQVGGTAIASFSLASDAPDYDEPEWRREIERAVLAVC
jgi:[protein-PII] uridylyltransferase